MTRYRPKGHLDIEFASAGAGELDKPIGTVIEEGFDDTFDVNVRGTLFTVQNLSAGAIAQYARESLGGALGRRNP
jgi:NAD(P)-dependent dehydrogenase (short-subunit alcohol dehydrogenase family)